VESFRNLSIRPDIIQPGGFHLNRTIGPNDEVNGPARKAWWNDTLEVGFDFMRLAVRPFDLRF